MRASHGLVAPFLLAIWSCAARPAEGGPARSPSLDYPPPPAQTSDGEVVGADRQPPGDKLATGPRAGSGGLVPASRPAGGPETPPAKAAPCKEIGLMDANGKSRCRPAPVQGASGTEAK